jgi:hypothetical protein
MTLCLVFGLLYRNQHPDEVVAQGFLELWRAGELPEAVGQLLGQRLRQPVGAALDLVGGLELLDHAEPAAGQRGGDGEVGVGVRTGDAVLDPARLAAGFGDAQADGPILPAPLHVDGGIRIAAEAAIGVHVGGEERHRGRHEPLQPGDVVQEELRIAVLLAREEVLAGRHGVDALVDVHRAAGLALQRLGHEGGVDAVLQGGLPERALEEEGLVGELQRVAVVEVDLHLRRTRLVGQRVDVDRLCLAPVVDILENRVELVGRLDPVGLARSFRAPGAADRRLERVVGVGVDLGQEEFELRCDHRAPAALGIEAEDPLEHLADGDGDRRAVVVEAVGDHLGRGLVVPGHEADGRRIGPEPDVAVDRVDDVAFRIVAGHRLDEDALGRRRPSSLSERRNL